MITGKIQKNCIAIRRQCAVCEQADIKKNT